MTKQLTVVESPEIAGLAQNPAAVYLASLRPTGRRSMKQALNVMAGLLSNGKLDLWAFPWHNLRYQHTAALRALLVERYSLASVNKMLSALRRVLKEAWRLGQMEAEDYHRAVDLPVVRGETLPSGRALASSELQSLMQECNSDKTAAGARDAALLAVLYGAGLRRNEIVKLQVADYDRENRALTVRGGKGGKDRLAYLANWAVAAVNDWLKVRGNTSGALFCPVNKKGEVQLKPMTDQAVMKRLKKRGVLAGVAHFSPHDLRRTFISDLLDAGADIATVQKLAGHASVTTTARYDRRGEATKKQAADLLSVPYDSR